MPTQAFAFDQPVVPYRTEPEERDDYSQWFSAPVDPSLEGVTEVFDAELVGQTAPVGEGVEASALDDLFGDNQFRDFGDEPLIPAPPPRQVDAGGEQPPRGPRVPFTRTQKILIGVAGGLVALLALVGLFARGTRVAGPAAAPSLTPSAGPTPTATALAVGPLAPGEYQWGELLGGECLAPFESAWQDQYTVVDCATAHPAQLVYRGVFDDAADASYPGTEELQKRINLLCTAPTVIDYAAAGAVEDIQVAASYAVDDTDWSAGNRTYFCFATRSGGGDLTTSIALPQAAPSPEPSG